MHNFETNGATTFEGHNAGINSVAFSADGKILASGSKDGRVGLWFASPAYTSWGERRRTTSRSFASPSSTATISQGPDFLNHLARVNSIAFSPTGDLLASGGDDDIVRLWDLATRKLRRVLRGHSAWVNSIAFSPDGKSLATGSEDKTVCVWNLDKERLSTTRRGHAFGVSSIAFSSDSKLIAAGSFKTIRLWEPDTERLLRTLDAHSHWVNSIAFSPDGTLLAMGSSDCTIKLWSVPAILRDDQREPCLAILVPAQGAWMAVTPDGRYKLDAGLANALGFCIGLCRFDAAELDTYASAGDHPRRVAADEPLFRSDD